MKSDTEDRLASGPVAQAWAGTWIWQDASPTARNAYALFRRGFATDCLATLDVRITADSFYWLFVDGQFRLRGPARAPLAYYSFDSLSVNLEPGSHCLAVLVHHVGEVNATMMKGRPGLLADVTLIARDGPHDLSSSACWRCLPARAWKPDLPCLMSHFGFWEELDLCELPADWTAPAFAHDSWPRAVVIGTPPCPPWTRLVARDVALPQYTVLPVPQLAAAGTWQAGADDAEGVLSRTVQHRTRQRDAATPAALSYRMAGRADGGRYLTVDFGRTVSGYVRFVVAGAAPGQVVDVSFDELLPATGAVNPERSYAHLSDRYRLRGARDEVQGTHPRGFRYVTLDVAGPQPVTIEQVTALEETYPFVLREPFTASDPQLPSFYARAAETVRVCTTDAFTDCPTRERVHWMEDLYLHSLTALYAFGDAAMPRRALFQAAQCALPDGRINGFFPSERTNCAFASSSLLWLALLVDYWQCTGATDDLERLLPTAHHLLQFLTTQEDADGLLAGWPAGQFWDWAPIEGSGCLLVTNAAYAWCLARLGGEPQFRDLLPPDADGRLRRLRERAHARFWLSQAQLYTDARLADGAPSPIRSQAANLMAVLGGVCPAAERQPLLRRITDPALLGPVPVGEHSLRDEMRSQLTAIVPVGTLWFGHWLCRALFENGLDREALAQMRLLWGAYDDLPTFPETRIQRGNTGHCHGWASGPAFLLPAYVLGLQPAQPGWREVWLRPCPGDLAAASGAVQTPRGRLAVAWRRDHGRIALTLEAPPQTVVHAIWGAWHETLTGGPRCSRTIVDAPRESP